MTPYIRTIVIVLLCSGLVALGCVGQVVAGLFLNLDFELASVGSSLPGDSIPVASALPYWTCNNEPPDSMWYDATTLDFHMVSLHDGHRHNFLDFNPLQGAYSVMLQDGVGNTLEAVNAYISQVGDVPSYAKSIMFSSDRMYTFDRFEVSLGGTTIPMHVRSVGNTVNPTFGPIKTYIGDISAFAGATDVELRFTKLVQDPSNPLLNHGQVDLDAITFSTTVSPEPSSLVLLIVGIFSLAGYYWQRRNRAT